MSQKFEKAREDNTMGNTPIKNFLGPPLADAATKCPVHHHDHLTSIYDSKCNDSFNAFDEQVAGTVS